MTHLCHHCGHRFTPTVYRPTGSNPQCPRCHQWTTVPLTVQVERAIEAESEGAKAGGRAMIRPNLDEVSDPKALIKLMADALDELVTFRTDDSCRLKPGCKVLSDRLEYFAELRTRAYVLMERWRSEGTR